jgi:hypothetical protein
VTPSKQQGIKKGQRTCDEIGCLMTLRLNCIPARLITCSRLSNSADILRSGGKKTMPNTPIDSVLDISRFIEEPWY